MKKANETKNERIAAIAESMGGSVGQPIAGIIHGPVGAARLAAIMAERLKPSQGKRVGRPTNPEWVRREKVPMKEVTVAQLHELARAFSNTGRKVSPMQIAAQFVEEGLERLRKEDGEVGA